MRSLKSPRRPAISSARVPATSASSSSPSVRVGVRHERADPTSAAVVVQPLGEGLGLAQALQRPPDFTELAQHRPQLEADLEALLQRGRALRQRLEDAQRLLEPGPGVRERRPRGRLASGLPEIVHRLLPQLAPEGVMGEPLDVLAEPIPVQRLDRLHDARVHGAPARLRQTAVGHLVRQRVREGIFQLGKEIGLVQKLRRLQPRQARGHGLLGQPGNVPQQRERDIDADDRRRLQQVPLLRAAADRSAPPAPPAPSPGSAASRRPSPGNTARARLPGPASRPTPGPPPPERRGCPRPARSTGA